MWGFIAEKINTYYYYYSLCSSSIFLTFWIELMFPKDGQILVDDFRHQNFGIWTFLVEVMAILVKKWGNFCIYNAIQWFCKHFSLSCPYINIRLGLLLVRSGETIYLIHEPFSSQFKSLSAFISISYLYSSVILAFYSFQKIQRSANKTY